MENNKGKKAIVVTYLAMFLEGGLNNAIGALMMMLAIRLARNPGEIALLGSVRGIGTLFTLYISGIISDKKGRKGIVLTGGILFAFYNIGMIATSNYYMALFYSFISGLAHGLMDAPSISIIFDAYREKSGPFLSVTQVFFGGGGVITSYITAYLMDRSLSYNYLFGFYLTVSVMTILMTLFIKFPPQAIEEVNKEDEGILIYKNQPSMKREGLLLLTFVLVNAISGYTVSTWLPLYVQATKGILESDAVQSLGYYLFGSVIGALFFSQILRKIHSTKLLNINSFCGILAITCLIFSKTLLSVYTSSFFIGFFLGNFFSIIVNLGGEFFPSKSGGFTGLTGTASMAGGTAVISITGFLVQKIGVAFVMWLSLVTLIVVFFLSLVLRRMYSNLGKKVFEV